MKKVFLLSLVLLVLSGCSSNLTTKTLYDIVDEAVELELPDARINNAKKDYYTYYIPRGIGREERDETSNLFTINNNKAILNLDIASIIQDEYYEIDAVSDVGLRDIGSFTYTRFVKEGTCLDSSGQTMKYRVMVSASLDEFNYVIIQSNHFNFTTICPVLETDEVIYEMIKILRSCTVNREKIISDYSSVDLSQHKYTFISLFQDVLPESGYIADYIEDWKNDERFIIIDYKEDDVPEVGEEDSGENGQNNNENAGGTYE